MFPKHSAKDRSIRMRRLSLHCYLGTWPMLCLHSISRSAQNQTAANKRPTRYPRKSQITDLKLWRWVRHDHLMAWVPLWGASLGPGLTTLREHDENREPSLQRHGAACNKEPAEPAEPAIISKNHRRSRELIIHLNVNHQLFTAMLKKAVKPN